MDQMDQAAAGKVILITGAGRGIGQAMALAFAQHGAAALVLAALEDDELRETARLVAAVAPAPACRVLCRALDVRQAGPLAALVAEARAAFGGRVDVLCANAGIPPQLARVGDADPAAWWRGLEVNLQGCFLAARAVLPAMQAQAGGGRLLFTSSIAAGLVEPATSSYQIAKLAVTRLADCIDVEYAAHGVRAFAVHPGRINTRLLQAIEGSAEDGAAEGPAEGPAEGAAGPGPGPGPRPPQHDSVETLQNMCLFLLTPDADFLSGRWVDATRSIDDFRRSRDRILQHDLLRAEVSAGWDPAVGRTPLPRKLG